MPENPALEPFDEFNQTLLQHVHPPEWTNPQPSGRYNLVVLGAGTAGLVTAAIAAGLGAKVALVERSLMGGDCLNVGCVPSKAILSAARVAATVQQAAAFGLQGTENVQPDFSQVMQRMRRLRAGIAPHDSAERFRDKGVDVFFGHAAFADAETVEVDGQRLSFAKAVIATGARASAPPIPGLDQVDYLTNETVFSLTELPRRMGVIGAGPIGCELAQAFARLGSEVFLIESADQILPREDADAAAIVAAACERDGVKLLCCGKQLQIENAPGIRLHGAAGNHPYDEQVDQLLVAAGRRPNIEDLNLEAVGVDADAHGIRVNDRLQTTNPRIFAAGDVASRFQFTHAADFLARIVVRNALFQGRSKASSLIIPWATYTSPEVAHVGLYAHEAEAQGIAIDTYVQPFDGVDRAILDGHSEGFVKVHTKRKTDKILGATIVAENAGDLISELTLAMRSGVGLKTIGDTIHPYPTHADAIRKLGDQFNRTRLSPFIQKAFRKWLSWTR